LVQKRYLFHPLSDNESSPPPQDISFFVSCLNSPDFWIYFTLLPPIFSFFPLSSFFFYISPCYLPLFIFFPTGGGCIFQYGTPWKIKTSFFGNPQWLCSFISKPASTVEGFPKANSSHTNVFLKAT
jgi:hypothetical protein